MFQNTYIQIKHDCNAVFVISSNIIIPLNFVFHTIHIQISAYCKSMPLCSYPRFHNYCGEWEGWDPVNWFNHTNGVAFFTPTYRKSVRNCCVIEVFGGVFVLSRCFMYFPVGVEAFVIGLSQISSFFSLVIVLVLLDKDNEADNLQNIVLITAFVWRTPVNYYHISASLAEWYWDFPQISL